MMQSNLLDYATDKEREEIAALLAVLPVWKPDARNKPQCMAYETEAFETLYGGAAGGGKSDLILGLARTNHRRSLLMRREFPDLERSLISRSLEFYGDKRNYNASKHVWNINDMRIEFGHMERVGTPQVPADEEQYASAPYDLIAFDQLEQFPQYAYEFMMSRARSADKNQRVRMVSSANPVGEGVLWIMQRWAAWLDEGHPNPAKPGEIRYYKRNDEGNEVETTAEDKDAVSRTFIPAGLADNPYLGDGYRRQLNLLPEPLRSAVLHGKWAAMLTDDAYQVIPRVWVKAAMERWKDEQPKGIVPVIGVDVARGGDDKTVRAKRYNYWIAPLLKTAGRNTPDGQSVADLVSLDLLNGGVANLDVIGVGASAYDISRGRGLSVKPCNFANKSEATDKSRTLSFVNMRAELYWKFREWLDPANYAVGQEPQLPPDSELLGDLVSARWKMQTNGVQIESKEDIKKRLGRSPDCSDAAVMTLFVSPDASTLVDFA
jgi:hypothetical protein